MSTLCPFSRSYASFTDEEFMSPEAFKRYAETAATLAQYLYNEQTTGGFRHVAWIRVTDGSRVLERWEIDPIRSGDEACESSQRGGVELATSVDEKLKNLVINGFETSVPRALARSMALLCGLNEVTSIGFKLSVEIPDKLLEKLPAYNSSLEEINRNRRRKHIPQIENGQGNSWQR